MTSSKLRGRRGTPVRPHVCHPPPKPVTPWPPQTFPIHVYGDTGPYGWPPYEPFDWTLDLERQGPLSWSWHGEHPPYPYHLVHWLVNDTTKTAHLTIHGTETQSSGGWAAERTGIPITWGNPTDYLITTWDYTYPDGATVTAEFRF